MALSTKLVAASVNRTVVNAPYAPTTVRRLFETANNFKPRSHKVTAIPAWIAGSRKRLDGSVQSKTFVNGAINQQRHSSSSAVGGSHTRIVPDFSKYRRPSTGDDAHRAFTYALIGATGVLTAAGTKSFVVDVLSSLAASADTLALAKVE
ncbi:7293_t:CDS:2, partial [Paraglomus occultum]